MSDDISIDDLLGESEPKPAPKARKPRAARPKVGTVQIDNAVQIRALDWRCVCDNTNTHSLLRCGKCHAPRYTMQ